MQRLQSLKRLLLFYTLTLVIMLSLYYAALYIGLKDYSERHSVAVFDNLQYDITQPTVISNDDIKQILKKPYIQDISYQLIFMLPSGQTYIYNHTRAHESKLTAVSFPTTTINAENSYQLDNQFLRANLNLEAGHELYLVLRHQRPDIHWTLYRYWLPLIVAIILFIIALLYTLRRHANWQQLLLYTDNLSEDAKEAYSSIPFALQKTSSEFLRLGYALSRVKYQLNNNHRRIKILKNRLERLVDGAPLPMLMMTRQGQISFFNPRFEQVFATAFQRETTYTLSDFLTGSDKSTQQLLLDLSAQRVTRTLLVYGLENNQPYQLHITPWFGEHGQVRGFTALLNNVNYFIKQSKALCLKNQNLERQVKSFSKLRSVIGHELRTPLNAIISTLAMVDKDNLNTAQQETLEVLTQSSHSMLTMLNDMLDMAKIEAGRVDIVNESTDIFKLGQHVSDLMIASTRRRDIDLLYYFSPSCPRYITTDGQRLCQIVLNLMDNAVKFTSSGYVALTIDEVTEAQVATIANNPISKRRHKKRSNNTTEASAIDASSSNRSTAPNPNSEQRWIRFRVKDTGIGISATEQQQLFSYFNQANPQINQNFGGTGLGLAISNSFAQLLGGFIHLQSKANCGSTFTVYMPSTAPIYQPVYHFHPSLLHIQLIAVVDQALRETYLQSIGDYLSMTMSVYSTLDSATIDQLGQQLNADKPSLTPILLLDYECYEDYSAKTLYLSKSENLADNGQQSQQKPASDYLASTSNALTDIIDNNRLPKILLSRKPERGIPSEFLDKFDGFLNKPINVTLMISELIRLAHYQPVADHAELTLIGVNTDEDSANKAAKKLATNNDGFEAKAVEPANDTQLTAPLILVVEDNPTNQKITCKLLSKLNYRSMVAENGVQALKVLKEHRQDIALVLMDCRMPIMDGLEATQAIRDSGDDIAIIALTANDSTEDRLSCQQAGMNEFLTKPIQKQQLQKVLQRFIEVS